ncbi:MAG: bifunctional DNA-formamidopyrimidine glycosylase/DNA-(apurinic or apyrimidinic site) lyase [Clostridiaceae bacterium]|nr:bifunctional DNA-formamidopyrimidine glycosylase/DNA-(apurinic or apyrimidinic site) lyase [Clostridiaceae bacterium]
MPELPEVETIRRSLLPVLTGRVIDEVQVLTPGVLLESAGLTLQGREMLTIRRRGKYLLIPLGSPDALTAGRKPDNRAASAQLIIHLRMTGQLLLQPDDLPAEKHTHIRIKLAAGRESSPIWLIYHDTRRFGRLWLLPDPTGDLPAGLVSLGPEPLDPDFNAALLAERLAGRRRSNLKAALLDQSVIAGLGNIYADEALYAGGLCPTRPAGSLSGEEIARLTEAIRAVLINAIACAGTSLRDYVDGWNKQGRFQNCLQVYGRAGLACRQCGQIIKSIRLAGRTTCWCPSCQPEKAGSSPQP